MKQQPKPDKKARQGQFIPEDRGTQVRKIKGRTDNKTQGKKIMRPHKRRENRKRK